MNFLRTLFWVAIAVSVAIFAANNWRDVTIALWGSLLADVKIPILMGLMFVLGWLPTWIVMRGRLWHVKRKLMLAERPAPALVTAPLPTTDQEIEDQ